MIRDLKLEDLLQIERSHCYSFPLPDINDPSYTVQKTILNGDSVVGAIFGRVTSESILVLDPRLNKITKTRLWQDAVRTIAESLISKGIKSTHIFVNEEDYAKLLIEHLGFVRATGIPLYLEVK